MVSQWAVPMACPMDWVLETCWAVPKVTETSTAKQKAASSETSLEARMAAGMGPLLVSQMADPWVTWKATCLADR